MKSQVVQVQRSAVGAKIVDAWLRQRARRAHDVTMVDFDASTTNMNQSVTRKQSAAV